MSFIIYFLMLVLFGIVMGFTYTEGLWSGLLRMINILISGMLAIGLGPWVFGQIHAQWAGFKWIGMFVSIWLVFDLCYLILFMVTKTISKIKVRFIPIVDLCGGAVAATFNGLLFLGFTLLTFHVAPLPRDMLWGGFNSDGQVLDTVWGKLAEHVSTSVYKADKVFTWEGLKEEGSAMRSALQAHIEGDQGLFDE